MLYPITGSYNGRMNDCRYVFRGTFPSGVVETIAALFGACGVNPPSHVGSPLKPRFGTDGFGAGEQSTNGTFYSSSSNIALALALLNDYHSEYDHPQSRK